MAAKRQRSPYAPPKPVTPHQAAVLDAIRTLSASLGRAPNATEVGAHLGISQQGARKALRALEARGLVQDMPKLVSSGHWQVAEEE